MIALKSDAVWTNLSRFGRPYPPFDYGSGMGVEDVDRDEAIELGLLPKDEPVDEVPDFDLALESEVSLDRIPEDLREQFIKDTPNAEVRGDKLVMRSNQKLPTWEDRGLESAKTWKPSYKETTITKAEAEQKLKYGFSVKDYKGDNIVFSDKTIHWRQNPTEKEFSDNFGRLIRLPMAEICVSKSREVWELPNGFRNYILNYFNTNNEFRGVAVSVNPNGEVHTYYVQKQKDLDKFRKGECIHKK